MVANRSLAWTGVLVAAVFVATKQAVLRGGLAIGFEVGKVAQSTEVTRREGALLLDVQSILSYGHGKNNRKMLVLACEDVDIIY